MYTLKTTLNNCDFEKNSAISPSPASLFAYSSDIVTIFKSFSKEKGT